MLPEIGDIAETGANRPTEILIPSASTGSIFSCSGGGAWVLVTHHAGGTWVLQFASPYTGPRGTIVENSEIIEYIYRSNASSTSFTAPTGGAGVVGFVPTNWSGSYIKPTVNLPYIYRSTRTRVWVAITENSENTEYVYRRQGASTGPAAPTGGVGESEYVPGSWVDYPLDPTNTLQYVFRSVRSRTAGSAWAANDFGTPALWRRTFFASDFTAGVEFSHYVETWVDLDLEYDDNGALFWQSVGGLYYRITGGTAGARAWVGGTIAKNVV